MPHPVSIAMPPRAVPVLTWLAKISSDDFASAAGVLTDSKPSSRTNLAILLESSLPQYPPYIGLELITELFTLLNLHFSHGMEVAEIAAQASARTSLLLGDDERSELGQRLSQLMSTPAIWQAAKAYDVGSEYKYLLHTVRILTDVRPVFADDPTDQVLGAIITYTLKLDYQSTDGFHEVFINLAEDDLDDIHEAVARAKKKGQGLSGFLSATGVADLTPSSD
jgi:hypothetical protein